MISFKKACFAVLTAAIIGGTLCGCRREDGEIGSHPDSSEQSSMSSSMTTAETTRRSESSSGDLLPDINSSNGSSAAEDLPGGTAFGEGSGRGGMMR